ncbi:MAG TPA: adenylate/guanylate cyclase domain-containing protein [Dehalococcoidia bacterium]|nr:adenylate/guanylate cyclase domain-containing protein [Dehalococcoidia bacterium]
MRCARCQHENRSGAKFCEECAAPLARVCTSCGALLSPTAKFCSECAHPVGQAAPSVAQRFTSPESYTPKHLAEKILTSKAALEGERKQVTVLFADLKGSMELLADRDPEEARRLLDPVLERMMEAVHRFEGTVNQVMGDGIMALFGAPLAHEDHAVRACYAALRMQESLKRYTDDTRRSHGVEVQIRVGLNSGEVVVRSVGSDLRMDYTAVGQTTHLAARMEQLAPPGTVRLTGETVRLVEGYVAVRSLGPIPVKGLPDPIEIFELTGAGTARTRLQAAALRGLTRFVGRDAEVEHLRRVLGRAGAGRGQVVAVVGEAGVGKSRLTYEFTHTHRVQDWLILEAASVSYGKATSYLPVIDLLKGYFKISDRDDHREMRAKVFGRMLGLDRALEPLLSPLLALLGVPVEDQAWQNLDPPQRRQRTLDAVKRLLLRESQAQPLLVVFEDLHWIDGETQALLDSLVESLGSARLLLLVNYRPEYQHGWGGKSYYLQLRIDPLPPESCEDLLDGLLGAEGSLGSLKQHLITQTQGNPFFLEESIRALVETQVLIGERGAYRLAKPLAGVQVPATVQPILAARIDRLPLEEKRLLQAAAVIGMEVPVPLLQAIAEQTDQAMHQGLAHLQAAEFLYEARLFPDVEYTFKHGLTYQVAYGSLLHDRRRVLHARIVEAIEALYADRLAERVEQLAHHAVRGEIWDKAVKYLSQAGARAFAQSAFRDAVAYIEQALSALAYLPEERERLELSIDLRLGLRNSLFQLGEVEAGFGHLRDAEDVARTLGDERRLGLMSAYMSEHFRLTGHSADAVASAQTVQAIAERLGDLPLTVAANYYLGTAYFTAGDYRRTGEFLEATIRPLDGDLGRERFGLAGFPVVMARSFWAWALAERGEFDEGVHRGQEAIRLAEALNHPYSLAFACRGLGHVHGLKGDLRQAALLLERGVALCREWNLHFAAPTLTEMLGYVYALSGRLPEGLALLQHALAAGESIGFTMFLTPLIVHLGEVRLLADEPEEAAGLAARAVALAREHGQRSLEAYAQRLLGDITAQRDPLDAEVAEGRYREALALAAQLDMRPLMAHCHLGLGKIARRMGRPEQAQDHLATATTMWCEMDGRLWLERAEAEMRGLG